MLYEFVSLTELNWKRHLL